MQKRLLVVLLIVVVYRFLSQVPVPLAEPTELRQVIENAIGATDLGGFLNLLSGGGLASLSIVLVGLSPYITASVVTQLLTKAIPKLEELHKDGESGRRKINQWTRMLTVPLAVLQSIAFIFIIRQTVLAGNTGVLSDTTIYQWVLAVTAMSAGAILMMWLGELITEQGVGNGISLLIFAGIISQLPSILGGVWGSLTTVTGDADKLNIFGWFALPINGLAFWVTLAVSAVGLLILYILVKINEAQRVITINYAKRVQGNSAYSGVKASYRSSSLPPVLSQLSLRSRSWRSQPSSVRCSSQLVNSQNSPTTSSPGSRLLNLARLATVALRASFTQLRTSYSSFCSPTSTQASSLTATRLLKTSKSKVALLRTFVLVFRPKSTSQKP